MNKSNHTQAIPQTELIRAAELTKLDLNTADMTMLHDEMETLLKQSGCLNEIVPERVSTQPQSVAQLRDDIPQKALSREKLLANAPAQKDGCFAVPLMQSSDYDR